MMLKDKYQIVSNFRLSNFFIRVYISTSESLENFAAHQETFSNLQNTVQSFQSMNISELSSILEALKQINGIDKVEIVNPTNHNSFIFEYSDSDV
jgi:hypothetical protein